MPELILSPVMDLGDKALFGELAEIHRNEIHEGFLSTLGATFLAGLYESLAVSDDSFLIVARQSGGVVGFIVGAMDTGSVYKQVMKRSGVRSFLTLLPKLFSIKRLKRIAETLLYPNKKKDDDLPEPEILNFCVRSEAQGTGVGSALFGALCDEFRKRGVSEIRIVTGETQKSAQVFYERRGARLAAQFELHKDTSSRVYVFTIPEPT